MNIFDTPTFPIHAFVMNRELICANCETPIPDSDAVIFERREPLCLDCSGYGHLEFLPSGNASVTKLAKRIALEHGSDFAAVYRCPCRETFGEDKRIGSLASPAVLRVARERARINAERKAAALDVPALESRTGCPRRRIRRLEQMAL